MFGHKGGLISQLLDKANAELSDVINLLSYTEQKKIDLNVVRTHIDRAKNIIIYISKCNDKIADTLEKDLKLMEKTLGYKVL